MNIQYKDEVESFVKKCNDKGFIHGENTVDNFRLTLYKFELKSFDDFLGDKCNVTIMQKVYTQSNNIFTDLFDANNMPTENDISYIYSQYKKYFEKEL